MTNRQLATLLSPANSARLAVCLDGGKLIVPGPKSQAALAERMLSHKADVAAFLTGQHNDGGYHRFR